MATTTRKLMNKFTKYIRISASYLFQIPVHDSDSGEDYYLLVMGERRKQYQPVGGCYKYYSSAVPTLDKLGFLPEAFSNGVQSQFDLRLEIPENSLAEFRKWFNTGNDREFTFDREFREEVLDKLPKEAMPLFGNIKFEKVTTSDEEEDKKWQVYFDKEKQVNTVKPMDTVIAHLTKKQQEYISKLVSEGNEYFALVTIKDIASGKTTLPSGKTVPIGPHTKWIIHDSSLSEFQKQ